MVKTAKRRERMGTRKEVKSMSAEEAEGMEERYIRAREVYTAVSMLMAHPPEGQEERLKEVAIIKAAVEADQFSWPEVLLAGLNDKVADWQRELLEMNSDNEMPVMPNLMPTVTPVDFECGRGKAVSVGEDNAPEFSSGQCHYLGPRSRGKAVNQ